MERIAGSRLSGDRAEFAFTPCPIRSKQLPTLSRKHRLPVVSFLSGWSYSNEGLCLASPKSDVRQRAVDRLIEYVGQAAQLGAVLVVGLMQGLRSDEANETEANRRIADCLRPVAQAAAQRGATVVLEPVNHLQVGFNHTAAEAAAMVERVGSPGLSYMLDTIHLNIEERSVLDDHSAPTVAPFTTFICARPMADRMGPATLTSRRCCGPLMRSDTLISHRSRFTANFRGTKRRGQQ